MLTVSSSNYSEVLAHLIKIKYITIHVEKAASPVTALQSAILRIESCIKEFSHWMSANLLKLNVDKIELLLVGSRRGLPVRLCWGAPVHPLRLGTETVVASDQVHVLGETLSSDLSIDNKHLSSICTTYGRLCRLRRV